MKRLLMASALCALAGPAFAVDLGEIGVAQNTTCAALWSDTAPGTDDAIFRLDGKDVIVRVPGVGDVIADTELHNGATDEFGQGLIGETADGQSVTIGGEDFSALSSCGPCPEKVGRLNTS